MFDLPIMNEMTRVLASLVLVLLAMLISRWQSLDLEKQMLMAVVRAFIQLTLIGYALTYIFDIDSPLAVLFIISVMTLIAGYTSGKRAEGMPHARLVALGSISLGAALTLGLLVVLRVFSFSAQQLIPIAGMVIGNSMNVCSLVMRRIGDEVYGRRIEFETALALGATRRQAADPYIKTALQNGMMPIVDSTKTVGLIQLPGAMTGMRIAYSLVPITGALLAIWAMWNYDLTEERAHEIRAELEKRRGKSVFA